MSPPDADRTGHAQEKVMSSLGPFEHRFNEETGQNSLYATRAFKVGEAVHEFHAVSTYAKPNMYTLQAGANEHIDLGPPILQYTNHSCTPSVFFNTTTRVIEALVDIAPGDQITFFYPSTEFEMDVPFECVCGTAACRGRIQGARHTSAEVLAKYRINDHIKSLLAAQQ